MQSSLCIHSHKPTHDNIHMCSMLIDWIVINLVWVIFSRSKYKLSNCFDLALKRCYNCFYQLKCFFIILLNWVVIREILCLHVFFMFVFFHTYKYYIMIKFKWERNVDVHVFCSLFAVYGFSFFVFFFIIFIQWNH